MIVVRPYQMCTSTTLSYFKEFTDFKLTPFFTKMIGKYQSLHKWFTPNGFYPSTTHTLHNYNDQPIHSGFTTSNLAQYWYNRIRDGRITLNVMDYNQMKYQYLLSIFYSINTNKAQNNECFNTWKLRICSGTKSEFVHFKMEL